MASVRQICTTTAINTVSCYKSNCIRGSLGNPGDCRFVEVSSTRQSRLIKRNGVSETNLHNHCNQHGQLLQIQLYEGRTAIQAIVDSSKCRARASRDWSNKMASARQICTTTAINIVNCYKSSCISLSHGNAGDGRSSELPDSCSLLRASRMIAIHHFSLHFNHVLV
jgi:hypothetical protein